MHAVAIATPASAHSEIALRSLEAGKHVLVEKPLASTYADGEAIVLAAERLGVVLMCDHTFCYTPVVEYLKSIVDDGTLGDIQFFDSVRINLGLVQNDIDVLWDLAPHDLSILDYVLPDGLRPVAVAAHGADPDRGRAGLRRVPHAAAARGCHRARPRELAEPDQGPDDDDRGLAADAHSGTT